MTPPVSEIVTIAITTRKHLWSRGPAPPTAATIVRRGLHVLDDHPSRVFTTNSSTVLYLIPCRNTCRNISSGVSPAYAILVCMQPVVLLSHHTLQPRGDRNGRASWKVRTQDKKETADGCRSCAVDGSLPHVRPRASFDPGGVRECLNAHHESSPPCNQPRPL